MTSIDDLPADQASALRLLVSGMAPDRVGEALSISPSEVVDRAFAAADSLAGSTADALAESERKRVFEVTAGLKASDPLLDGSPSAQAYQRAISSALDGSGASPAATSAPPVPAAPPLPEARSDRTSKSQPPLPKEPPRERPESLTDGPKAEHSSKEEPVGDADAARKRGVILLGCVGVVLLAVILAATGVFSGGSSSSQSTGSATTGNTPNKSADGWQLKNRLQLTSPTGGKAAALAGVETKGSQSAIAITGLGLPPKAVVGIWISGGGKYGLVGFQQVGTNGRFSAIGALPANASTADTILVSRENYSKGAKVPTSPGETLLSGRFSLS